MIFMIVCIVLAAGFWLYHMYEWGDWDFWGFATLALIVVFAWMGSWITSLGVCVCAEHETFGEIEKYSLYAVSDNIYMTRSGTSGTTYNYMVFEEGKGLTVKSTSSNVYINYVTSETEPYVEIQKTQVKSPVIRALFQFTDYYGYEYYFYVPSSAYVSNDYTIDME